MSPRQLIGVALHDAGWHPGALIQEQVSGALLTGAFWAERARAAESGGVDLLTLDDTFGGSTSEHVDDPDLVPGRLDAQLVADFIAPLTRTIGLLPVVTTTHTEPFHTATALQTLDFASRGRAGWQVRVSPALADHALVSRRSAEHFTRGASTTSDLFDEAREFVEVVRRLWDSWEEDAIIRDLPANRFIDRDRIHNADFHGRFFNIEGASISPRSPQGQPVVSALSVTPESLELAADVADIVFVRPRSLDHARQVVSAAREASRRAPRQQPLQVWADIAVVLEGTRSSAERALDGLNHAAGRAWAPEVDVLIGTTADARARVDELAALGFDGVRLLPARTRTDTVRIADAGLGPEPTRSVTLRERLGLGPAINRYQEET